MNIKILSNTTINRISAGEVIERPSSVVKELVENAIDAGALHISISLEDAGKNLIIVQDDGIGMTQDEMQLAIQRHATSKLDEDDLLNINSFGFRGEALPSIGAISKFKITSKKKDHNTAYSLSIHGGELSPIQPALLDKGTIIEVRDLFFATPARLKFLRSDRAELNASIAIIKSIMLAHPQIAFTLTHNGKTLIKVKSIANNENIDNTGSSYENLLKHRIEDIFGKEFMDTAHQIEFSNDIVKIYGYSSIPQYNRASSDNVFIYINNRPVKDKILSFALKLAYQKSISHNTHPISILFLVIDPHFVDVNVHPAKTEVRFHDPNLIRSAVINAIKSSLLNNIKIKNLEQDRSLYNDNLSNSSNNDQTSHNQQSNSNMLNQSSNGFKAENLELNHVRKIFTPNLINKSSTTATTTDTSNDLPINEIIDLNQTLASTENLALEQSIDQTLGNRAIIHINDQYIVTTITNTQSTNIAIMLDTQLGCKYLQHQEIKEQIIQNSLITTRLSVPVICDLAGSKSIKLLHIFKSEISKLGLIIETFGERSIIISKAPIILEGLNFVTLLNQIAVFLDTQVTIPNNEQAQENLIEFCSKLYADHIFDKGANDILDNEQILKLISAIENDCNYILNHYQHLYITITPNHAKKLFDNLNST